MLHVDGERDVGSEIKSAHNGLDIGRSANADFHPALHGTTGSVHGNDIQHVHHEWLEVHGLLALIAPTAGYFPRNIEAVLNVPVILDDQDVLDCGAHGAGGLAAASIIWHREYEAATSSVALHIAFGIKRYLKDFQSYEVINILALGVVEVSLTVDDSFKVLRELNLDQHAITLVAFHIDLLDVFGRHRCVAD